MEGVFQFLLIIAFIAIGILRQVNKEKSKKDAANKGHIPVPPPIPTTPPWQKPAQKTNSSKKIQLNPYTEEGVRTTHAQPTISAPPQQTAETEPAEKSEYAIDSPEEARRAIIWSEILQRKY